MKLGKGLRSLRVDQDLSLRELGERCGLVGDELAHYERGDAVPRQENTNKIAQALNEPISYIQNGVAWNEVEEQEDRLELRTAILNLLRDTYGTVEVGQFHKKQGKSKTYFTVGSPPNEFVLYENDLSALEDSVRALISALVEHMKDSRPEKEIIWDILNQINTGSALGLDESEHDVTDEQWYAIKDLFPPENRGRGRALKDNRLMLNGILYWMKTGVSWEKLPKRFGRYRTVYDRLILWNKLGIWPKALERMLELKIVTEDTMVFDGLH